MPPRPMPLAYAGRKLIGPPEGYDRKKELQVKKWLNNVPPGADAASELAASVASMSEVSGQLEPGLHDLYGDLRDSTDGKFPPQRMAKQGILISKPAKQAARPVNDLASVAILPPGAQHARPLSGANAVYPALIVAPTQDPSELAAGTAGAKPLKVSASDTSSAGSTVGATLSLSPTASPSPRPTSPLPPNINTNGATQATSITKIPYDLVAPLDSLNDILLPIGPAAVAVVDSGRLGGAAGGDGEVERQSVAVAAGLLVARAEAAAAARGAAAGEEELYKVALLMAVREKQRLSEEMRGELAGARAACTAAIHDAAQKAAAVAADAAAAAKREAAAVAELAQMRAQMARVNQDAKVHRMDHEDREEEHATQVAQLKAEVAAALSKLTAQGDSREQAMRQAQEESMAGRQAAAALDRQYKHLKRQYDLDKARMDMQVAELRVELQARDTDMANIKAERQQALDNWKVEVVARMAAEESEDRALKAAAKQVPYPGMVSA